MTIAEQIKALQARRKELQDLGQALVGKAETEKRDFTDEEQKDFDGWLNDIEGVDEQLARLARAEKLLADTAAAVPTEAEIKAAEDRAALLAARPNADITSPQKSEEPFKASRFTRLAIAMACAKGHALEAAEIAKHRWPGYPEIEGMCKAAVAPHDTNDAGGTGVLVQTLEAAGQFIDLLRPATILGRIPGIRRIEFDNFGSIRIPKQTGGVAGGYVGEDNSIRVQRLDFGDMVLTPSKLAVIVIASNESLRRSNPSLEALIRDDMVEGTAETMDTTFLSAVPAADNPAGILFGKPALATGAIPAAADVAGVSDALRSLIMSLRTANVRMISPVWLMNPRTVEYMRLQRSVQDIMVWKQEIDAGSLLGWPIVQSNNVNADVGGGGTNDAYLVLVDAAEVFFAEDLGPVVDASEHATIQADDAPATPPDLSGGHVSLWQQDKTAFRLRMSHSWARRRDEAINYGLSLV